MTGDFVDVLDPESYGCGLALGRTAWADRASHRTPPPALDARPAHSVSPAAITKAS